MLQTIGEFLHPLAFWNQTPSQNSGWERLYVSSQAQSYGSVDLYAAKRICRALTRATKGVLFPEESLVDDLWGGACSAMSFEFADTYLQKRTSLSPSQVLAKISPNYTECSRTLRARQAAYNTIQKDPSYPVDDFKRAKIEAMLKFHNRHVVDASQEIDLTGWSVLKKIEAVLERFQRGVFVIRCIRPEDNHKGEYHGHSMILIREKGCHYFYDPCEGIYKLQEGTEAETIYKHLLKQHNRFTIPIARFYQIA